MAKLQFRLSVLKLPFSPSILLHSFPIISKEAFSLQALCFSFIKMLLAAIQPSLRSWAFSPFILIFHLSNGGSTFCVVPLHFLLLGELYQIKYCHKVSFGFVPLFYNCYFPFSILWRVATVYFSRAKDDRFENEECWLHELRRRALFLLE
jgi:hypothetical protein